MFAKYIGRSNFIREATGFTLCWIAVEWDCFGEPDRHRNGWDSDKDIKKPKRLSRLDEGHTSDTLNKCTADGLPVGFDGELLFLLVLISFKVLNNLFVPLAFLARAHGPMGHG
ncbi:hypothetical protein BKA57DRAFT_492223 [Linnemannia elongata]|nr:hypothetical protein BKA57DRAFT_492223 [Linnemannia elongata]